MYIQSLDPDYQAEQDELINKIADQFATYLKSYDFDGLDEVTGQSFTEWLIDKVQDGGYEGELTDLITRSHTWIQLHALDVATDYAKYLIDFGEI